MTLKRNHNGTLGSIVNTSRKVNRHLTRAFVWKVKSGRDAWCINYGKNGDYGRPNINKIVARYSIHKYNSFNLSFSISLSLLHTRTAVSPRGDSYLRIEYQPTSWRHLSLRTRQFFLSARNHFSSARTVPEMSLAGDLASRDCRSQIELTWLRSKAFRAADCGKTSQRARVTRNLASHSWSRYSWLQRAQLCEPRRAASHRIARLRVVASVVARVTARLGSYFTFARDATLPYSRGFVSTYRYSHSRFSTCRSRDQLLPGLCPVDFKITPTRGLRYCLRNVYVKRNVIIHRIKMYTEKGDSIMRHYLFQLWVAVFVLDKNVKLSSDSKW